MGDMPTERSHRDAVRARFDDAAPTYDAGKARFADRHDDMLGLAMQLVRREAPGATRFLDLGTGTGAVSLRILETFPGATAHGVDFSEKMIEHARARLSDFENRFTLEMADLAVYDPVASGPWDVVLSALAIHHLADDEKRRLVLDSVRALRPGGIFLNGDLVAGETLAEQEALTGLEVEAMRSRGIPEEEIQDRLRRHRENDTPARLSDQVAWLREAGCHEVWVPWRHLHQALMVGIRPAAGAR